MESTFLYDRHANCQRPKRIPPDVLSINTANILQQTQVNGKMFDGIFIHQWITKSLATSLRSNL